MSGEERALPIYSRREETLFFVFARHPSPALQNLYTTSRSLSLLLAYIDSCQHFTKQIAPKAVANRVKELLMEAKVNTETFGAHSIRSAASTATFQKGLPVTEIKIHANWGLNSDTIERLYLKTNNRLARSRKPMYSLPLDQD
ncbi:hypothetical protein [Absidia glauca]|uniref:Uncharacterized protein n=1 Tax=Absidia glauca TaxID=4829 RepID=A0A163L1K7_ABSGL|nr:hypothetical protein [Absidia glauca]